MKLENLQKTLKEKGIKIFTPRELRLLLNMSGAAAARLLWRYESKKIVVKLRRGLYALRSDLPSTYTIGNRLYQPSYISFDTAMSFHGLIPETIYSITCATVRGTREYVVSGVAYRYRRIKKAAFTGYRLMNYFDSMVLLAEPEKALADYLYFVDIGKRGLYYERLNLKNIHKGKLIKFIKLFRRKSMLNLVDKIYAQYRNPQRIY